MAKASAKVVFSFAIAEQVLVLDDDQGVDHRLQFDDALLRHPHPVLALEMERLGDHPDGQDAHLARGARDHGRGAGAGAAAHPGGDEHHMRARQVIADLVQHLVGGGAADIGMGAGAEPFGHLHAHLDDPLGLRHCERLGVGIGDNEIDPLQPCADHIVDGISARTADPEHGNPRPQLPQIGDLLVDAHACLFDTGASPTPLSLAGPPPAALVDLTWVSPSRFQPPRAT